MAAILNIGTEWNGMNLAILNLHVTPIPPTMFGLNPTNGYRNRTILAILNFYIALMPPIKFQLNPTCGFGGDVI